MKLYIVVLVIICCTGIICCMGIGVSNKLADKQQKTLNFYNNNYDVFSKLPDLKPATVYYGFDSYESFVIIGNFRKAKFYTDLNENDRYNINIGNLGRAEFYIDLYGDDECNININSYNFYGNKAWVLRVLNEYLSTGSISREVLSKK